MLRKLSIIFIFLLAACNQADANTGCGESGLWLQVLGSGGPELDDGRASSGYLIWQDGRARVLVDMGSGSMFHFEKSGASISDLDVILLSHMHVDHSNDLPSLIKASFFSNRNHDLLLYGPSGNHLMPSVTEFAQGLLGARGAYQYLNSYLDGSDRFRLVPSDVNVMDKARRMVFVDSRYKLSAVPVHHGPIPSLAWRVEIAGKTIVFSGDMSNKRGTLAALADQANLMLAHNAIPEGASGIARNLHMPPSEIGKIAANAQVKNLVLSHRMNRTLGQEEASVRQIRKQYKGPLQFADDLQCFGI